MSANTIITSVVTAGTNNHTTTAEEANAFPTDFVSAGVVGAIALNTGSGGTGSFAVNQDTSPDMGITVKSGQAYVLATPASQGSQLLRSRAAADYTAYTINANATGSTKYDWIYLQVNPTNANSSSAAADNVTSIYTSRSSSNSVDNGTPPTYGLILAVVTVANGASSITNANISDKRTNASVAATVNTELIFDFIQSGCVWSGDAYASTRLASCTAGIVYISGKRLIVNAVANRTFTASKDVYCDLKDNSDGTAVWVYYDNTTNAASPSFATTTGTVRGAIIVVGATNIAAATSVNQGQETRVLPIASSIPYAVTDSLGNLICPRDPSRTTLGYRQIITNFSTAATSDTQVTGLSCPVIVPLGRKVEISFYSQGVKNTNIFDDIITIWDGTVGSGTQLQAADFTVPGANYNTPMNIDTPTTPSAASKTYNVAHHVTGGTGTVTGGVTFPAYVRVKLA